MHAVQCSVQFNYLVAAANRYIFGSAVVGGGSGKWYFLELVKHVELALDVLLRSGPHGR